MKSTQGGSRSGKSRLNRENARILTLSPLWAACFLLYRWVVSETQNPCFLPPPDPLLRAPQNRFPQDPHHPAPFFRLFFRRDRFIDRDPIPVLTRRSEYLPLTRQVYFSTPPNNYSAPRLDPRFNYDSPVSFFIVQVEPHPP